ncbi:hypothetical protein JG687_00018728 [Phytophthora cactorum]|uniref:RxLR effector protein n=3 Tax=Phytophthora cactorum TaxID=29920 RepID=A0A8T1TP16_9STRA|nr:hypothetical protein Pcac1_g22080 [Phytophthora cactorum]KAG3044352.1 hypothetical protein PC121_g21963 [Phytophthora cactorum]KAG6942996.1 hypothetical protein JG687_00018728 [Phytophthora cactorum]
MRQAFVALVLVIVLQATCGATSHDSINQFQSPKVAVSKNNAVRSLRVRGTDAVEEERAINFKNLFDIKKWVGLKGPAKDAPPFAMQTIKAMLRDKAYRSTMFKQWDLYKLDEIPAKIGAENMKNKRVAKMLIDYRYNGRDYTK